MAEQKRITWIDVAKGIGIILVTMIHASTSAIRNASFGAWILYSFCVTVAVPIMTFLSGYSVKINRERYSNMNISAYLKKKFMNLLLPYISYSILIYSIFEILSRVPGVGGFVRKAGYGGMPILTFLKGFFIGNNEYSIHLWFLYVLFVYEVIAILFVKFLRNDNWFILLAAVMWIIGTLFYPDCSLAWGNGLLYFVYFVFGLKFPDNKFAKLLGIISLILWMLLFFVYFLLIYSGTIISGVLSTIIPMLACIAVVWISKSLSGSLADSFVYLGQKSMTIYLFQQPFFGSALGTIMYAVLGIPAWLSVCICIIMCIVMPLIIRVIFVRFKWFRTLFAIR